MSICYLILDLCPWSAVCGRCAETDGRSQDLHRRLQSTKRSRSTQALPRVRGLRRGRSGVAHDQRCVYIYMYVQHNPYTHPLDATRNRLRRIAQMQCAGTGTKVKHAGMS